MGVGGIFVDGANISRSLSARAGEGKGRFLLDYGRLAEVLERLFETKFLFRTYYTAHRDEESLKRREPFYEHLRRGGWTVFDHPAKFVVNSDHPEGLWIDKGIDLAIGLDAYRIVLEKQVSVLVVATHDEDFVQLFKRLPTSVAGAVVGWKGRIAMAFEGIARRIYLDDLDVLTRR